MEQSYWLGRKRASIGNARRAAGAEARLVHLDLAGRYSVKAAEAAALAGIAAATASASSASALAESGMPLHAPAPDAAHYERLEIGARWLASRAATEAEREEHLSKANDFVRLRLDAALPARRL